MKTLKGLVTNTVLERTLYKIYRRLKPRASMSAGIAALAKSGIVPKTIVDVGASDGRWSEMALRSFPGARCVLFEPQTVHREGLERFRAAHPSSIVVAKAVGGKVGRTFFDITEPFGGWLTEGAAAGSVEVELTTIDAELEASGLGGPYLIKLDTHGVERSILEGAARTVTQSCALIIEAYNYRIKDECLLFWELCDYLSKKGFRPIDMVDVLHRPYDNTFFQADIIFIRDDWPGFKYCGF